MHCTLVLMLWVSKMGVASSVMMYCVGLWNKLVIISLVFKLILLVAKYEIIPVGAWDSPLLLRLAEHMPREELAICEIDNRIGIAQKQNGRIF